MTAADLLALDLSATSTGWAAGASYGTLAPPSKIGIGARRLLWIYREVYTLARPLVVVEDYAYNAHSRATTVLAEVRGVVLLALHQAGSWVVTTPSSVRQKIATGKGNARKAVVMDAARRYLGYEGDSDDEADALWLQQIGLHVYGLAGAAALPPHHLDMESMKGYRREMWPTADAIMERWHERRTA